MFKRAIPAIIIVAMACFSAFDKAAAQESQVIHFQGVLTGTDGGPLRTDIYDVNFSIWDQESGGVEPLWTETQVVEVTEGLFDVFLGNVNALSADVFTPEEGEGELRYLEIQVEGDDPMTPRTQIGKTPNSFVSSRVLGDIVTGPGSFRMAHPPEGPGVEMIVDDISNSINFRLVHPPEQPAVDILSDAGNNRTSFRMAHPPEAPEVEIVSDGVANSIDFRLVHPPEQPAVDILSDGGNNRTSFRMAHPPEGPTVEMISDNVSNTVNFRLVHPPEQPAVDILSDAGTSTISFRMAHPPEGPDPMPAVEMDVDPARTSFRLMDPTDEIVGFDVFVGSEGNSLKLKDPGYDDVSGLEMVTDGTGSRLKVNLMEPPDEKPAVEIFASDGGVGGEARIYMFNPQPEPPATDPLIAIITGGNDQANFRMFNPQAEPPAVVMDISSTPFSNASFKMFNTESDAFPAVEMAVDQIGNKRLFRMGLPPDDQMPAMEMATGIDENSFKIASPVLGGLRDEITDPKFEVVVDSDGGRLNLYDEVGKYMGLEPMPFVSGGGFYMVDPSTEQTNVWIDSNGRLSVRKGIFGQNITSDGNYNLAVGDENIISGDNCFAGGRVAEVNHDNCFVWSDYPLGPSTQPTQTSADNQFLVRSTGGAAFFSNATFTSGVALAPDASSWSAIIPPGPELNTRAVDGEQILTKIGQLPLRHYSRKERHDGIEHIGPLPKDFNELFGAKGEDACISMSDEAGVALAGVKALLERIEQLESRIAELEAERR